MEQEKIQTVQAKARTITKAKWVFKALLFSFLGIFFTMKLKQYISNGPGCFNWPIQLNLKRRKSDVKSDINLNNFPIKLTDWSVFEYFFIYILTNRTRILFMDNQF